jgi:hypothetical protein
MLQAYFEGERIITTGDVEQGDIYPSFCCTGHNWEVRLLFPDEAQPEYTSIWGWCNNLDCPDYQASMGPGDPYRGVSSICREDFEEWLAKKGSKHVRNSINYL